MSSAAHTLYTIALGAWVAHARKAAGLNQEQLGARVGVSQPVISRWERGKAAMGAWELRCVAGAVGATLPQAMAEVEAAQAAIFGAARALAGKPLDTPEELLRTVGGKVLAALASGAVRMPEGAANRAPPQEKTAAQQ
jgi:transcriptional regulator with XRE-family HTH domain